jgi:hypothetical protein
VNALESIFSTLDSNKSRTLQSPRRSQPSETPYLYFAHHVELSIRFANDPLGAFTIHGTGVLALRAALSGGRPGAPRSLCVLDQRVVHSGRCAPAVRSRSVLELSRYDNVSMDTRDYELKQLQYSSQTCDLNNASSAA